MTQFWDDGSYEQFTRTADTELLVLQDRTKLQVLHSSSDRLASHSTRTYK